MSFVNLIALIRTLGPAMYVIADAFRYGLQKHGGETWKTQPTEWHIQKAANSIVEWLSDRNRYSLLADAGLRLLFALSQCATSKKYFPKKSTEEKPAEEKIEEQNATKQ